MSSPPGILIVGGGLAGLAAASALSGRGLRISLLESRPRLGGRATSFLDQTTGELIDNCQHVSMGCCTNFAHFCRQAGIDSLLERQQELYFIAPDGQINRFSARPLPTPLHLLSAFRGLSYLSNREKRLLSRGLKALAGQTETDGRLSFEEWLIEHGQTPELIERFWFVVLVSALSESLDRIDVAHARKVFVDGFLTHREAWKVDLPVVPLGELYGERLRTYLEAGGVEFRLQTGVENVTLNEKTENVTGVRLRDGDSISADHLILAVPHDRLPALLPARLRDHAAIVSLQQLQSAPISSVHLWFDRPITDLPHAVFVDRTSQWLFNRNVLHRSETEPSRWHYYQVVISASRGLRGCNQEEIIDEVCGELAAIWPAARTARLKHARVITEHKAVFSPLPGVDEHRPPQQSPVPNLQFAGDWTRTGWPATMEGAVRSGYLAAENVLRHLGRPAPLLQPDLPVSILSRLLLGL